MLSSSVVQDRAASQRRQSNFRGDNMLKDSFRSAFVSHFQPVRPHRRLSDILCLGGSGLEAASLSCTDLAPVWAGDFTF